MITEEEVIDAADEILLQFGQTHVDLLHQTEENALTLAQWVGQHLAGREIDRIERAKPITPEWCLSRGAKHWEAGDEYVFECGVKWTSSGVYYDHRGRDPWRHVTALPERKTCGQLSDLINALKGGES